MPHAINVPASGFQAVILCGPGVSLNTFTANPDEFPKALVPIANRPMVWYPLDWCYRMGISNIQLITPPSSAEALEAALSQNPHLTSLPLPKADILAPKGLSHTTPTAEILRLPEVQAGITGDFLILPCDLVCDLPGESLLEAWMIQQGGLGGASYETPGLSKARLGLGGEIGGRRGGLGVWYETKGGDTPKGAETDFVITTPLSQSPAPSPEGSLRPHVSKLLYATTTDTLRDITTEKKGFHIRHGLVRKHGKIRMLTTHRDAHIYLFPYWTLDFIKQNEKFDSISEDVVGWWAKAGWQDGLPEKLHLNEIFSPSVPEDQTNGYTATHTNDLEADIDLAAMSSTHTCSLNPPQPPSHQPSSPLPEILAYVHPPTPSTLLRRVDTPQTLLSTSLHLATLAPSNPPHPYSHLQKISPSASLIAPHTTIHAPTTLIAPNTTIATHVSIKSSVIGANCVIEAGAKITGSLLMDGVVVGEKAVLMGCIVGRRAGVGKGAVLRECEVQEGYVVGEGVEGKGEKFCVFEGLDGEEGKEFGEGGLGVGEE